MVGPWSIGAETVDDHIRLVVRITIPRHLDGIPVPVVNVSAGVLEYPIIGPGKGDGHHR
jgi:hypothetical protein